MSTSLSRAFTTKRTTKPKDVEISLPQRSLTTKNSFSAGAIRSRKISAPIELISTTNMLSYNAPDIYPRSRSSTTSSTNSDGRSLASSNSSSPSSVGTPFTSPENSSVESSPTTASPEPNHLSCYFGTAKPEEDVPKIPVRAVSHTKKSAEYMARKRSISRMSSPKNSISRASSTSTSKHSSNMSTARSSVNMFNPNPETVENPFGNELAQVSELVEEYGSSKETLPVPAPAGVPAVPVLDEEERELLSRGLFKFRAEDYMSDLQGLFVNLFSDSHIPVPQLSSAWI